MHVIQRLTVVRQRSHSGAVVPTSTEAYLRVNTHNRRMSTELKEWCDHRLYMSGYRTEAYSFVDFII